MNIRRDDKGGEDGDTEGVSLRKLDKLMQGSLPKEEAERLRREIARSPKYQAYLERYSSLQSGRSLGEYLARTRGNPDRAPAGVRERPIAGWRTRSVAWAFACVVLLSVGTWIWRATEFRRSEAGSDSRWAVKGPDSVAIRAHLRGLDYEPGDSIPARVGDTLDFVYRSPAPFWIQIWYQEDGARPVLAEGFGSAGSWPASLAWSTAPSRMTLQGSWRRQTVWIIGSVSGPLRPGEAKRILAGEAIAGTSAASFSLFSP